MSNGTIAPPMTIEHAVQRMYESFPYPYYPIFAKPQWGNGYLASSHVIGRLFEDKLGCPAAVNQPPSPFLSKPRTILVAGAGEAQPCLLRKLEPASNRLICVDLSRRSLRRARYRLGFTGRGVDLVASDINKYLLQQASVTGPFAHIDAYGVLHHLSNPSTTLRLMHTHLASQGTMRVMVYNSPARRWINDIQCVFRLLKLDAFNPRDRAFARHLLGELRSSSPALNFRLKCIGKTTIDNPSRFVDTFFHVREMRASIERWLELFNAARLVPFGLIDRYGELDDLPNPLWQMPSAEELARRSRNGGFENNLELFLHKDHVQASSSRRRSLPLEVSSLHKYRQLMQGPPARWFSFSETKDISLVVKWKLYSSFVSNIHHPSAGSIDKTLSKLPPEAVARLCRLGAVMPSQIADPGLRTLGLQPISTDTAPPEQLDMANFEALPVRSLLEDRLNIIDHRRPLRLRLILEHLKRAQLADYGSYELLKTGL